MNNPAENKAHGTNAPPRVLQKTSKGSETVISRAETDSPAAVDTMTGLIITLSNEEPSCRDRR